MGRLETLFWKRGALFVVRVAEGSSRRFRRQVLFGEPGSGLVWGLSFGCGFGMGGRAVAALF